MPLKYHQRLIGPRGANVKKLSERHDCQIKILQSEENSTTITVIGFESNANKCKEEIEQMIAELELFFTQELPLNVRFHPRLIGQKGRHLHKVRN